MAEERLMRWVTYMRCCRQQLMDRYKVPESKEVVLEFNRQSAYP